MFKDLPKLPDYRAENYFSLLSDFGRFIENNCRPGCEFDLAGWPNPLWQIIEQKLADGLQKFAEIPPSSGEISMLQWYNSGILVKTKDQVVGFDILPIPRYYGWPDENGFTRRLAELTDILFITHNHADHFDQALVKECNRLSKPVFMHSQAFQDQSAEIRGIGDQASVKLGDALARAHYGRHVWREKPEEVATTAFELEIGKGFRLVFCGDLDYTTGLQSVRPEPDLLFITWRNPGPEFEDGHPRQVATTVDAVKIVIEKLRPKKIILQHYAELDHVYKGFSASYEMALNLISNLNVPVKIFFWGDLTSF